MNIFHVLTCKDIFGLITDQYNKKWFSYILSHPEYPWNWDGISQNIRATMPLIERNLDKPWSSYGVSHNENLTMAFLEKHYTMDKWDWKYISRHLRLTIEFVEMHLDYPWDWEYMAYNPHLTEKFIHKYIYLLGVNALSHPHIPMDIIETHMDNSENMSIISRNPKLTMDFIEKHIDKDWNWDSISYNPHLTMDMIEKHFSNVFWDWGAISCHPNMTLSVIKNNPDKPWDWNYISLNPHITLSFIKKNRDKDWNYYNMISNPSLTEDIVSAYENQFRHNMHMLCEKQNMSISYLLQCNYYLINPVFIVKNPNFTMKMFKKSWISIKKTHNKILWFYLSINPMWKCDFEM